MNVMSGPVVVGFDGSDEGRDALVLGRRLAALTGGELTVAVVQPLDLYVTPDPVLVAELDAAQFEEADELIAAAAAVLGGEEGRDWRRWVVAARSTAVGLQRAIERLEAGIVVLGRTHHHGVARVLPGTTANRLLHGAPCPVAIAPPGWASRGDGLRTIAAGVDGTPESLAALALAAELGARAGATVEAISVTDAPVDRRTTVEHRVQRAVEGLPAGAATARVVEGRAADTLVEESEAHDLLVVGSRGYGPLRSVLVGDVASTLATHARCALLVTPRGAADPG